jgi:hypothetical protein
VYANRTTVTEDKSSAQDFVFTVMNFQIPLHRILSCLCTLQCLPDCNTVCYMKKLNRDISLRIYGRCILGGSGQRFTRVWRCARMISCSLLSLEHIPFVFVYILVPTTVLVTHNLKTETAISEATHIISL